MSDSKPDPCHVCRKRTYRECSHVDCPNRRNVPIDPEYSPDYAPCEGGYKRRKPKESE